ncbi:hypothetical protein MMC25_004625 [Agyrium rufum]|nr:hypothetical protein [Agyrium rufum]
MAIGTQASSILREDGFLLLTAAVIGFYAARAIHAQLLEIKDITRITKEEKNPDLITQDTEDAVKVETLQTLVEGANQDIRNAAIKIVCERAVRTDTFQLLLSDLASKDEYDRDRAVKTLRYLSRSSYVTETNIGQPATLNALVTAVTTFFTSSSSYPPDSTSPTNFSTRSTSESTALELLLLFLRMHLDEALHAGLVSRYLARYPFGGPNASEAQRMSAVAMIKRGGAEDGLMWELLTIVNGSPAGRKALRGARLVGSAIEESGDGNGTLTGWEIQENDEENQRIPWRSGRERGRGHNSYIPQARGRGTGRRGGRGSRRAEALQYLEELSSPADGEDDTSAETMPPLEFPNEESGVSPTTENGETDTTHIPPEISDDTSSTLNDPESDEWSSLSSSSIPTPQLGAPNNNNSNNNNHYPTNPRPRTNSTADAEEHALRRRRREAMVINDGGRPISRADIFQRTETHFARMEAELTAAERERGAAMGGVRPTLTGLDDRDDGASVGGEAGGGDDWE